MEKNWEMKKIKFFEERMKKNMNTDNFQQNNANLNGSTAVLAEKNFDFNKQSAKSQKNAVLSIIPPQNFNTSTTGQVRQNLSNQRLLQEQSQNQVSPSSGNPQQDISQTIMQNSTNFIQQAPSTYQNSANSFTDNPSPMPPPTTISQNINKTSIVDQFKDLGDGYWENDDGYYFSDEKSRKHRLTNFLINSIKIVREVKDDDDIEDYYQFELKILNEEPLQIKVLREKSALFMKELDQQTSAVIFEDKHGAKAKAMFKRILNKVISQKKNAGEIFVDYFYKNFGWGLLLNNRRNFYHGGLSNCEASTVLTDEFHDVNLRANFLRRGFQNFYFGYADVLYPALTYGLATYMDALFIDANFPLSHSLMLVGKSGYGKTSIARAIYAPLKNENSKIHSVVGTFAAMKNLVQISRDDTLIVDDYNLEGTRQDIAQKTRNLQMLIRVQADKTSPEKYGGDGKVKGAKARGGFVFTGEVAIVNQLLSSELRYLKIFLDKPMTAEMLTNLQQNESYWGILVSEWIRYLEADYSNIVQRIRQSFAYYRPQIHLKEPRFVDAFIHYQITAEIFSDFLLSAGVMRNEEKTAFQNNMSSIVYNLIQNQTRDARNREVHIMFVTALNDLLNGGRVDIAPDIERYASNLKNYVGYDNGNGVIMLKKNEVFKAVSEFFAERQEYFPTTADNLPKILFENGLTRKDKNGYLSKTPSIIFGRPNMIGLVRAHFENLLDQIAAN